MDSSINEVPSKQLSLQAVSDPMPTGRQPHTLYNSLFHNNGGVNEGFSTAPAQSTRIQTELICGNEPNIYISILQYNQVPVIYIHNERKLIVVTSREETSPIPAPTHGERKRNRGNAPCKASRDLLFEELPPRIPVPLAARRSDPKHVLKRQPNSTATDQTVLVNHPSRYRRIKPMIPFPFPHLPPSLEVICQVMNTI